MKDNSYWNSNGKYQAQLDALQKRVPREGRTKDMQIEAIRVLENVYYDVYNNGGGNLDHSKEGDLHAFVGALLLIGHDSQYIYRDLVEFGRNELPLSAIEQKLEDAADALILWASEAVAEPVGNTQRGDG